MPKLNPDEQAIIDKARTMSSETSGVGGDENGPPPAPATPSSPDGNIEEWGPYDDYFIVTPPWGGSFGVEKGKILYFDEKEIFVRREGIMKMVKIPRQRDPKAAEQGLSEAKTKIAKQKLEKAST